MAQAETPENLISSTTELIVNVPVDNNERQGNDQRWVFQKFADWAQETEFRVSTYINNNRSLLTLSYTSLFVVAIARIALHSWMVKEYKNKFATDNYRVEIAEISLSGVWLIYFIIIYTKKFRYTYTEDACRDPVLFAFFCIQYFMMGIWAVDVFCDYAKTWAWIFTFILFILYGFLAEKSPNTFAIALYCIFMCFIFESLVRLVICKCTSLWNSDNEPQYTTKKIPVVPFFSSKYEQKSCAICLREFQERERICQLSCYQNHIFHSNCMKEWLDRNHQCPYCRAPI